jgi:hypothetical protein
VDNSLPRWLLRGAFSVNRGIDEIDTAGANPGRPTRCLEDYFVSFLEFPSFSDLLALRRKAAVPSASLKTGRRIALDLPDLKTKYSILWDIILTTNKIIKELPR